MSVFIIFNNTNMYVDIFNVMKTIVLGPPGTGKTTTLLNKVDDYLKETDPDKVGYFAFTQKAAYHARDEAIKKI